MWKFVLCLIAVLSSYVDSNRVMAAEKPNILFIAIDDLNHWVGYTGRNSQCKTPNIDRLSKMGMSFAHAYAAAPVCNPSRAALMSGMRPGTSGVYDNGIFWKSHIPEGRGLTAALRGAGYYAAGAGKIYHSSTYYPSEWDDYFDESGTGHKGGEDDGDTEHGPKGIGALEGFHEAVRHDLKDEDLDDWHITNYCIEQLGKKHDKPFFVACGLHKPHLPWVVPLKYYKMFPVETIQLPPYKEDDLDDIPPAGLRMAKPEVDHIPILKSGRWKAAIQSYLACSAYTDMNVGRLLDALDKSAYRDNTIIVFWGDHGWHLGEKHHWRKFTLWEEATRAPFIWVVPGLTKPNTICNRTVDFMSIYPTLCELAGAKRPAHVEGVSIKPLLADPQAEWNIPGVTTFGHQNHSVRTENWRYIHYADGSGELYDEVNDPYEWTNLIWKDRIQSPDAAKHVQELSKWLPQVNKETPYRDRKEQKKEKKDEKSGKKGKKKGKK